MKKVLFKLWILILLPVFLTTGGTGCTKECGKALAELSIQLVGTITGSFVVGGTINIPLVLGNLFRNTDAALAACTGGIKNAGASATEVEVQYSPYETGPFEVISNQRLNETPIDSGIARRYTDSYTFPTEGWYKLKESADFFNDVEEHFEDNNGWDDPNLVASRSSDAAAGGVKGMTKDGYLLIHIVASTPEDSLKYLQNPQVIIHRE